MDFWRFSTDLANTHQLLEGSHDITLVGLSIVIACFAGITSLSLADRITASTETSSKVWWHLGGAIALACGIWAMHFTGMIAFSLPGHQMNYSAEITAASIIPAIIGSIAALYFIARNHVRGWRLQISALTLAIGIGTMHYAGMEAMEMPGLRYDVSLFAISILVAYLLSLAALTVRGRLRTMQSFSENIVNFIAGSVIGLSIAGMHYTAMSASEFYVVETVHTHGAALSDGSLATTVAIFAGIILGLSSLATWIDRQVGFQRLMHLQEMAHTDPLTALPNRALFEQQVDVALQHSERHGDRVAILYFDLNKFKPINDNYGHAAGDLLLREFAVRLQKVLRKEDLPARLGGDEFAALLRNFGNPEDLAQTASRILDAMSVPVKSGRLQLPLSVSIGISMCPDDGTSQQELLHAADEAMYRAKANELGYSFSSESLSDGLHAPASAAENLQAALDRAEITLLYQPCIELETRLPAGVKALARWPAEQRLSESKIAALAEGRGVGQELGDLVLRAVCKQAHDWRIAGLKFGKVAFAVNDAQLNHSEFSKSLKGILQEFDVPASDLEIEVSASSVRDSQKHAREELVKVADLGVTVTLDNVDADTSLHLLGEAPIQKIKFSREMVAQAAISDKAFAQMRTIATLSKELGYEIEGNGVQTEEQLERLLMAGASAAQGYLFSKPVSADVLATSLLPRTGRKAPSG